MERTSTAKTNVRNITDVLQEAVENSNTEDRVTKRSRLAEDATRMKPSKVDDTNQSLQDDLKEEARIVLRGVEEVRPELRGQHGQLLKFNAKLQRWLVQLDSGVKTYATPRSLQLQQLPERSLEQSNHISASSGLQQREASTFQHAGDACWQSVEALSVQFEGRRSQAMRLIEKETCDTCAKVAQLRAEVNEHCTKRPADFGKYCQLAKPTNFEQQQARNRVRHELMDVAAAVGPLMQRLHQVPDAPANLLNKERDTLLREIKEARDSLDRLHAETIETFAACSQKLEVDRRNTESTIASLAPHIDMMDTFMQCVSKEIQKEKAEADRMHDQMLSELDGCEKRFVADINSESQALEVHRSRAALTESHAERTHEHKMQTDMMQSWNSMMRLMPAKQQDQEKHIEKKPNVGFWNRFAGNFRKAAAGSA